MSKLKNRREDLEETASYEEFEETVFGEEEEEETKE